VKMVILAEFLKTRLMDNLPYAVLEARLGFFFSVEAARSFESSLRASAG